MRYRVSFSQKYEAWPEWDQLLLETPLRPCSLVVTFPFWLNYKFLQAGDESKLFRVLHGVLQIPPPSSSPSIVGKNAHHTYEALDNIKVNALVNINAQ